jgi:UPF0755 protein
VLLVLLLLVTVGGAGASYLWYQGKVDPAGEPGEAVAITIPEGASTAEVGELLEAEGVITSASVFSWYLRFNDAPNIQAGVYEMRTNEAMAVVVDVLEAGPAAAPFTDLTFPEGQSVFAGEGVPAPGPVVNTMVDGAGFDQAVIMEALLTGQVTSRFLPAGNGNLEGMLFPDTYRVEEDTTEVTLLQQMADRMDEVATAAGIDQAPSTVGRTPYEVLIIASLIERETLIADERPMVARVIYNRLEANNPLGIDATTQYAIGRAPETQSDFDENSAYNTRAIQGLPPTPIGIPGQASIEAALSPAAGDWFYYVLQDQEGHHFFTASAAEFEDAKARCQDLGLC